MIRTGVLVAVDPWSVVPVVVTEMRSTHQVITSIQIAHTRNNSTIVTPTTCCTTGDHTEAATARATADPTEIRHCWN